MEPRYRCPFCSERFIASDLYDYHLKKKHLVQDNKNDEKDQDDLMVYEINKLRKENNELKNQLKLLQLQNQQLKDIIISKEIAKHNEQQQLNDKFTK